MFVTAIGVCFASGIDVERLVEQVYAVIAKNDAKTHETHVVHTAKFAAVRVNSLLTRRGEQGVTLLTLSTRSDYQTLLDAETLRAPDDAPAIIYLSIEADPVTVTRADFARARPRLTARRCAAWASRRAIW